jgi:chromosome segregation ATPase
VTDQEWLAQRFESHRTHLRAVAYRMLGSLAEADDAVTAAAEELAVAGRAVEELQARSLQLQSEIDELKRRLAGLESDAEETDDELAEAEEAHGEAEQSHAQAVRERDAARKALDSLD